MLKTIQKMLAGLSQIDLQTVMNYCKGEVKERKFYDIFNNILNNNHILEIATMDGSYIYVDEILEIVSLTDGFAVRFSILGKDPSFTKATARLEFDNDITELPFDSSRPTLFFEPLECFYTPELNGVKTMEEGLPVRALSVCMLYRSCYDCRNALPLEKEVMDKLVECRNSKTIDTEGLKCENSKDFSDVAEDIVDSDRNEYSVEETGTVAKKQDEKAHSPADFVKKIVNIIDGINNMSDEEVEKLWDKIDIEQEIIDSVQEPLKSLADYVNGSDDVKIFTSYKVDRHSKSHKDGIKQEQYASHTANELYSKFNIKQVGKDIRLEFENDFNDDIATFEIVFLNEGDFEDPIKVMKDGTIKITLCEDAVLKLIISRNGKPLSKKEIEALMYA